MGKKRKPESDLDAERNLYSTFVSAANHVSQLYTQAIQQQRRASSQAVKQSLERILTYILRDHAHCECIPKAALLQCLQQEYEAAIGMESSVQHATLQVSPFIPASGGIAEEASDHLSSDMSPKNVPLRSNTSSTGVSEVNAGIWPSHAPAPVANASLAMDTVDNGSSHNTILSHSVNSNMPCMQTFATYNCVAASPPFAFYDAAR